MTAELIVVMMAIVVVGCGGTDVVENRAAGGDDLFPDVVAATVEIDSHGRYSIEVTISSPCDTPERYADAWWVIDPDGNVLGVRELAHDHHAEQPFTRSFQGVEIDERVSNVIIEGRDRVNDRGGAKGSVEVPRLGD